MEGEMLSAMFKAWRMDWIPDFLYIHSCASPQTAASFYNEHHLQKKKPAKNDPPFKEMEAAYTYIEYLESQVIINEKTKAASTKKVCTIYHKGEPLTKKQRLPLQKRYAPFIKNGHHLIKTIRAEFWQERHFIHA